MKKHIAWLLLSAAAVVSVLGLTGCGGGGSGLEEEPQFTTLTVTPVNARITLPTGTDPIGEHSIWTSISTSTPAADGRASVEVYNNGPQYTEVVDADGNLVLAGFLGGDRRELDIESTAEMFSYFAVGGQLQRGPGSSRRILNEVSGFPGFDAVVAAITSELELKGHVSADDASVRQALNDLVASVTGFTRETSSDPTSDSGLDINTAVSGEITVTNEHFRRVYTWLEATGYKDADGNVHEYTDTTVEERWLMMPTRYSGSVDSATGLLNSQYQWDPSTTGPLSVPGELAGIDDPQEVYYTFTTVGPGYLPGDFQELTGPQVNKWEETVYYTAFLDFYLPTFANFVLPLDGGAMDNLTNFALEHASLRSHVQDARSSMPLVATYAAQGDFSSGLNLYVTSSQVPTVIRPLAASIMEEWAAGFGATMFENNQDVLNRIDKAENALDAHSIHDLLDGLEPLNDISASKKASVFKITTAAGEVTLTPAQLEIGISQTTDIVANIKNPVQGATYEYQWTVTGGDFFLQDVDGDSTDESQNGILKSPHNEVFIGNLSNDEGVATIRCTVVRTDNQTTVGSAQTKVSFSTQTQTIPATYRFEYKITGTPGYYYGVTMFAIAEFDEVPGARRYFIVGRDANGVVVESKQWTPVSHSEIRARTPEGKLWHSLGGTSWAQLSEAGAQQKMEEWKAFADGKWGTMTLTCTVYFD